MGARSCILTGGRSEAHHRDSPSQHHFQSENPPGKPEGRITDPGPAPLASGMGHLWDLLSISSKRRNQGQSGHKASRCSQNESHSQLDTTPHEATMQQCTLTNMGGTNLGMEDALPYLIVAVVPDYSPQERFGPLSWITHPPLQMFPSSPRPAATWPKLSTGHPPSFP